MGCTMGKPKKSSKVEDNHSKQSVAKDMNKSAEIVQHKTDDETITAVDSTKVNGDISTNHKPDSDNLTTDNNRNITPNSTAENPSENIQPEGGVDPAAQGAKQEDRFYNNKSFQKPDIDPSDNSQQDAALKIQTKYRQHHAKQVVKEKRQEVAAVKIQAGYRGFQDRKKVKGIRENQSATESAQADEAEEEPITEAEPTVEEPSTEAEPTVEEPSTEAEPAVDEPSTEAEPAVEEPNSQQDQVDIDLNDPEVQGAATKIQAGFRGHKARKEVQERKAALLSTEAEQTPVEGGTSDVQDEEVDIDLNDPDVGQAATRIQAGFRGHQARKQVKAMKESYGEEGTKDGEVTEEAPAEVDKEETKEEEAGEEIDIDLEDPEVQQAAVKIQAGFAGMKARKEVKSMREAQQSETGAEAEGEADREAEGDQVSSPAPATTEEGETTAAKEGEQIDIDLDDPEVQAAATKIQASFKGYQTRKEFKNKIPEQGEQGEQVAGNEDGEQSTDAVNEKINEQTEETDSPPDGTT